MKELRGTDGFIYATEATKPSEDDMIRIGLLNGHPRSLAPESLILVPCPFSISCFKCDDGQEIGSREEAILKGWTEIVFEPEGVSYSYLGMCPEHSQLPAQAVGGAR